MMSVLKSWRNRKIKNLFPRSIGGLIGGAIGAPLGIVLTFAPITTLFIGAGIGIAEKSLRKTIYSGLFGFIGGTISWFIFLFFENKIDTSPLLCLLIMIMIPAVFINAGIGMAENSKRKTIYGILFGIIEGAIVWGMAAAVFLCFTHSHGSTGTGCGDMGVVYILLIILWIVAIVLGSLIGAGLYLLDAIIPKQTNESDSNKNIGSIIPLKVLGGLIGGIIGILISLFIYKICGYYSVESEFLMITGAVEGLFIGAGIDIAEKSFRKSVYGIMFGIISGGLVYHVMSLKEWTKLVLVGIIIGAAFYLADILIFKVKKEAE